MDFHKPKPWHGVREFLKEYLIIVVGVLTALAAEQGVEALRVRQETREVEARLAREVNFDLVWAAERIAVAPCMAARIAELRDQLAHAGETWRGDRQTFAAPKPGASPIVPEAFHAPSRPIILSGWQSVLGSRGLAALPLETRAAYSALFEELGRLAMAQDRERDFAVGLDPLSFDLRLTPELRAHYLDRLAGLARDETEMITEAREALAAGQKLHALPDSSRLAKVLTDQKSYRGACVADMKP